MSDKKSIFVIVGIFVIFVLWKFDVLNMGAKPDGISFNPAPIQTTTAGVVQYKQTNPPVSFIFDNQIFYSAGTSDGVSLTSKYYVVDNLSGDPKNDSQHAFSVTIQVLKKEMLAYIKTLPYGSNFMTMFPDGIVESFTGDGSFAEKVVVNGKMAYKFTVGVEGANVDYYFISLDKNKTAVITVSYFTDFLKQAVKPTAFSETSEKAAVKTILDSLQF